MTREYVYKTGRRVCDSCGIEVRRGWSAPSTTDLMPCGHAYHRVVAETKRLWVSPVEYETLARGRITVSQLATFHRVLDQLRETERDIASFPAGAYKFADGGGK